MKLFSCKFKGRSLQEVLPHVPWSSSSVNLRAGHYRISPPHVPWRFVSVSLVVCGWVRVCRFHPPCSMKLFSCKFKGRSLQDFVPHVPWRSFSVNLRVGNYRISPHGPWNSSPVDLNVFSPPCSMKLFFCKFKGRSVQDLLFHGPWNSSPVNLRAGHYRIFFPMSIFLLIYALEA